ncbi:hypothetical protein B0H10DRAFT_2230932 [Mycena sp. CBHHK59/15]|nr:hypothetical protein B0H10DRAFT_2230932 [Mycena sp. CBHHK59/15]
MNAGMKGRLLTHFTDAQGAAAFFTAAGRRCQLLDWKGSPKHNQPHKVLCSRFKEHMCLLEIVQTIIKSFPWGRVEQDGTFHHWCTLARFNVLGGAGFGFWSQDGLGIFEEEDDDKLVQFQLQQRPDSHWAKIWKRRKDERALLSFINGQDLLKEEHLNDAEGWKLPAGLIVPRSFPSSAGVLAPSRLGSLVRTWDEWHAWRGVPKASPASLLMHYPLSIYWMLVNTLKLTCVTSEELKNRPHLTIHYIGAEVELNFLPIFSELALLLPNHDLDLVFFGPCVFHIGQKSLEPAYRTSMLARKAHDNIEPVFIYTAPDSSGAGSLRLVLHTETKYWTPSGLPTYGRAPDALLACNAGLFTYDASHDAVRAALVLEIPFAVTDYQQFMLEGNALSMAPWRATCGLTDSQPIDLNPFHRPGQRFLSRENIAPNLVNGFTMAVYNKPTASD